MMLLNGATFIYNQSINIFFYKNTFKWTVVQKHVKSVYNQCIVTESNDQSVYDHLWAAILQCNRITCKSSQIHWYALFACHPSLSHVFEETGHYSLWVKPEEADLEHNVTCFISVDKVPNDTYLRKYKPLLYQWHMRFVPRKNDPHVVWGLIIHVLHC